MDAVDALDEAERGEYSPVALRRLSSGEASRSSDGVDAALEALLIAARVHFDAQELEEALCCWRRCERLLGGFDDLRRVGAEYGAVLHNIGTCYHRQSQWATAQSYYEQAIDWFDAQAGSATDAMARRRNFTSARLQDLLARRMPDQSVYLDENGCAVRGEQSAGSDR